MSSLVDRRHFLFSLAAAHAAAAFAPRLLGQQAAAIGAHSRHVSLSGNPWLLIGTHDGAGIYRAHWDGDTGKIGSPELAVATPQPTYLIRHPHLPVVYACNETDLPGAAVSAFQLDPGPAALTPLATQRTEGAAPCYASIDRTGRLLFTANYSGGSLSTFALNKAGLPSPATAVFKCADAGGCGALGPVKDRQDGPHLHCANLSPDNGYVLACDLGDDSILVFPLHTGAGDPLGRPVRVAAKPGSGPRHLAFHPNGHWLYCIHELDCTVALLHWQPRTAGKAAFVPDSAVSILPGGQAHPGSTGAEIVLTRDGRFAYASTRGANLLTLFAIDASDGRLQKLQQIPCGGDMPRFFALDPTERWLVCAHQNSNTLTVFARDPNTGALTPAGTTTAPNPECLLWV